MKETRDLQFFKDSLEKLAQKQNEKRDEVLDAALGNQFTEADSKLKELQTISVALQVCQQTIMRENDRIASEKAKENAELAKVDQATMASVTQLQPNKKKGWFR